MTFTIGKIYSAKEKLEAIERELRWREKVYPNRVTNHRMSQAEADYQIAVFEAIRDDYQQEAEKERLL